MKKFSLILLSLVPSFLIAQSAALLNSTAPVASGVPSPVGAKTVQVAPQTTSTVNSNVNHNPPSGFFESQTTERMADRVFDVNKDSFNFEDGTLNWKGRTFNIGNSRIVKSRFERYLASGIDLNGYTKYQAIIAEIVSSLSANNDRLSPEQVKHVWSRLFDAAEYEFDADSSLLIANVVYLSMRMKEEYRFFKVSEYTKRLEMENSKRIVVNESSYMEYATIKEKKNQSDSAARRTQNVNVEGTARLAYLIADYQKDLKDFATATVTKEAVALKAITQFQSQAYSFAISRKFQSALIACMFYRHIYRGNAQEMIVGKEQIQDLFKISNFVPTMDLLESTATEARREVRDGMNAVNSLYDSGERYGALQRLMETFVLGEYDPAMLLLAPEKRKVLHKIYKASGTIKELADSKDWGGIEELLNELRPIASDFPEREILAKLRAAKQASDMFVLAAKQSAALGKVEDVRKNLEEAAKIWPLNPAISTFNNELIGLVSGATKFIQKFDELMERGDFRGIANESPEFAMALRNDQARSEKLRDIVVKIGQIDMMIAQASEFEKQNNPYFAWEILENAKQVDSSDPVLARAIAKLAPEVSDYVKIINNAKKAENQKRYACALNYYLAAQMIFPASRTCRLGIERVAPNYLY